MDLDQVLEDIGEYGRYQQNLLFFVFLPCMFPCAFHAYNQLFMTVAPLACCNNFSNISEKTYNCTCSNGFNFNYSDLFNFDSIFKELQICESNFHLTIALVFFGIAGFIGSYVFGYLQDRVGRKPSFFIYLFISCVFGIITAITTNFWNWLIFRFGVGFTVPAILSTPYILPIELVGPTYRTRCTILNNIAYSLGLVALSGVVYIFGNWRYMALATSVPFLLFFIYWRFMPESPRWLLASGKFDEAVKILQNMAKVNGTKFTNDHLLQLQEYLSNKKYTLQQKSRQYGVMDLFNNKNLRFKTLIITFIWFTNTSVYVGLSYYAPVLSGDKYLNFFLSGVVELPTYLVLWPSMEKYGRREIMCSSMFIGGLACLMTSLSGGGKMGISSSYVVLPLFVSELYPTVVRGIGISVGTVAGMLGPVFIPIVNYLGIDSCLPLIIMGALLFIGSLFSVLLPETKDVHLEETIPEDTK